MEQSFHTIHPTANPFTLFGDWFSAIKATGIQNHDAVNISTLDRLGHPESRMVLMRRWNERGLSFFTHYSSPKSQSIEGHPWGHMCFFWQIQEKQIRIQGAFERTSVEESDEYWASRPHESQVNALASSQSAPLSARAELENRVQELTRQWEGKSIPRPTNWGGWRLVPWRFEFWQGHPFRLHDRVVYQRFSSCPDKSALLSAAPGGQNLTKWTQFRIQP